MTSVQQIYLNRLEVCTLHAERLRWAMGKLSPLLPFTEDKIQQLTDEDLAVLDQFIVRFSKLQDAMGAKLFPTVLELTYEQGQLSTFIDKLNRLEKIGAIDSASYWLELREMRNLFAHDYPNDAAVQASILNKAFDMAKGLLGILVQVIEFAARYLK